MDFIGFTRSLVDQIFVLTDPAHCPRRVKSKQILLRTWSAQSNAREGGKRKQNTLFHGGIHRGDCTPLIDNPLHGRRSPIDLCESRGELKGDVARGAPVVPAAQPDALADQIASYL